MLQNRRLPLVYSLIWLIFRLNYMLISPTIWSPKKSISSIGRFLVSGRLFRPKREQSLPRSLFFAKDLDQSNSKILLRMNDGNS